MASLEKSLALLGAVYSCPGAKMSCMSKNDFFQVHSLSTMYSGKFPVHRAQRMDLEKVIFDMQHIFDPGQLYTGLSRVPGWPF